MLLKDKYKPKNIEDLHYFNCYNIIYSLKTCPHFSIILHGKNNIGKTLILNILKNTFDKNVVLLDINNYTTKNNILLIDDLDILSEKEQFKIKKYLELGGSFIATISNIHKIIKDVYIRCIVVELDINYTYYNTYLHYIIQQEGIILNNYTIEDILIQSNYNIAYAINLLQKLLIIKTENDIHINNTMWNNYYTLCLNKSTKSLQELLNKIIEKDYCYLDLMHSLLNYIKFNTEIKDDIQYKIIKLILYNIQVYGSLQNNTILLYIFTNKLLNILC